MLDHTVGYSKGFSTTYFRRTMFIYRQINKQRDTDKEKIFIVYHKLGSNQVGGKKIYISSIFFSEVCLLIDGYTSVQPPKTQLVGL